MGELDVLPEPLSVIRQQLLYHALNGIITAPDKEAFGAAHFAGGFLAVVQNGSQFGGRITGARFGRIVGRTETVGQAL